MNYAVIMAGGSGTRFWPMSTKNKPKQFLKLFGNRTMIQSSVDRLDGLIPPDRCMVLANERHLETVRNQLPHIPESFLIGEPIARNTAPCIALAAQILVRHDPDAVMIVLTADHRIEDEAAFRSVLETGVAVAEEEECLITIGIRPDRPETGYGYIRFDPSDTLKAGSHETYRVGNFTEKPDRATAKGFLDSGEYLWNSGMFIWKASTILEEFRKHQPEIYQSLQHIEPKKVTPDGAAEFREGDTAPIRPDESELRQFYESCPAVSIDYGIMEKAEKVRVVPGDFGWSDVGSWKAVHELAGKDDQENSIAAAAVSLHDSSGNLIQSESGKIIALAGVENMAVVETDEAILVCNLSHSQDVRKIVEELKADPEKHRYL